MGFSTDNLKGFALALLSSGFIGASFIIKKKGLRRAAAASGVRAGVGGYAYLLEPLWWGGMITMIVGEVANFVAYAFAPAVLVTPLGALSIIVSAFLAHFMLKEKLQDLGILGCVMCIAGSVVIVVHAPQEKAITSVQEIWRLATQICICSLMGSLSVMSVKALGTAIKLTFEGKNQLAYPETWFFMLVVLTCVITQMNYLNKALDTFNTAIVSPIYYVMFTTLTILASVIMFKDWDDQDVGSIISEICGFIVVLSGTILLHVTKDYSRSTPRTVFSYHAGAYPPLSPSLSTRLCGENGEFLKHVDEEMPPPEEMCLRRQELY
ncbi:probable magnesium transporter NIPA3 isoform X3 [Asparagus officinalis]|uniref:probable magnesium transporter NIPA3 isoform X3 n=1 Tax=Asparagus officinalis TaxID=4686 RepID=UPI00098E3760|nr:probable magnesium transporter NIPA3 isoform X3 [Asparagus officinalis]